jgi:hypothetical protein
MAAALPIIGSVVSGVMGAVGGSKGKTSTSTQTTNQSGRQDALLDPKQKKINKNLFQQILAALKLGPQVSQSDRNTARGQINDTYDATGQNLQANMAARGMGGGGTEGRAMRSTAIDRAKGFQGAEATLRDQAQNRFQQMISNAFQFNQPRSFTNEGTSTTTGSQTMPGQSPWSSIGQGVGDLSSLMFMRNMQNQQQQQSPWVDSSSGYTSTGGPLPCWIARAIYGEQSIEAMITRVWLLESARLSFVWFCVLRIYQLFGRPTAWFVRRSETLKKLFRPIFNWVLKEAMNA